MSLNPGGASNYNWNYSNPNKDGFSEDLTGTIVSLQEIQAREFSMNGQLGRPRFWPDGNPVMNIRVGLATADGALKSITFAKAGKKQVRGEKPSLHMSLYGLTNGNMMELIGKTVHLHTWSANPNTGQTWGQGNPRMFAVEEVPDVKYELATALPAEFCVPELLADAVVSGGQLQQPQPTPPQQIQVPQVQPMAGQFFAPPTAQAYQVPAYQQPQQPYPYNMQQPAQFQPQPAIQQMPPMSAPMPSGMDPAVAAAMQAAGATNVQPVSDLPPVSVYDNDIPF